MKDVYRVPEIAERLGLSKARIYQMIASEELPSVRLGGAIVVPANAWKTWLDQQERCALKKTNGGNEGDYYAEIAV